jgi:hypothetical protein
MREEEEEEADEKGSAQILEGTGKQDTSFLFL